MLGCWAVPGLLGCWAVGLLLGCCWAVAGLLLGCCWAVAGLLLSCCWSVAWLLLGCCWAVAGLLLGCCWAVAGLLLGCCWAVAGLLCCCVALGIIANADISTLLLCCSWDCNQCRHIHTHESYFGQAQARDSELQPAAAQASESTLVTTPVPPDSRGGWCF